MRKLSLFVKAFFVARPRLLLIAYALTRWLMPLIQHPFRAPINYIGFVSDWMKYVRMGGAANLLEAYPCLFDRTAETKIDPQYFHQMIWGVRQIQKYLAPEHVDIGSDTKFVGILSVFTKVIFVDIRPLAVQLENLECRAGTILDLPFSDGSVRSLSTLHVIEHIGLGRYGDPLDPLGTEKACKELVRVLAPGGVLFLTTPIGRERVQFNGQRVQSIESVLRYFTGLELVSLAIVDPNGKFHVDVSLNAASDIVSQQGRLDFALGCFVFTRQIL